MMDDTIRVLVVDDEKVVRDGCRRVLTDKGYEALSAENGKEASSLSEAAQMVRSQA